MKKYIEKMKEKKGTQFIEVGIGLLIFVTFVAFFVDLLVIGNKQLQIGNETGRISRMMAIQGGVSTKAPEGFPGGKNAYTNTSELYAEVSKKIEASGVGSDRWRVYFTEYDREGRIIKKDVRLTPTSDFKVDYMHSMDVKVKVKYNWYIFSHIVPALASDKIMTSERHSVGEFKFNYDDWESEENNDANQQETTPEDTEDGTVIDDGSGVDNGGGDGDYIPEDSDYTDEDIIDPTAGN